MNKVKVLAPVKKADILVKDYKYDYAGNPVFVSEGGTGDTGAPLRGEGLAGGIGGALGALGGLAGQHRSLGSLANAMYFGGQQGSRMGRAARRKLSTAGQRARATERRNIGNEYADAVAQGRIKKPGMFTNIRERRPAGEVFSTGKHKREQLDNLREKTNQEEEAKRERQMKRDMRTRDRIRGEIDDEGKVAVEDTEDDDWSEVAVEEPTEGQQIADEAMRMNQGLFTDPVAVEESSQPTDPAPEVAVEDTTDGLATDAAGNEVPNTTEQGLLPPPPPHGAASQESTVKVINPNDIDGDTENEPSDLQVAALAQKPPVVDKNTWWKERQNEVQASNTTTTPSPPLPVKVEHEQTQVKDWGN